MIPTYLQGKSAVQIMNEVKVKFIDKKYGVINIDDYVKFLQIVLLIAVKDALCNCDEVKELIQDGEYHAQQRAIAFLNLVLPFKE